MPANIILFGKSQLPLFQQTAVVSGYTRGDGRAVAAYAGRRARAAAGPATARRAPATSGDELIQSAIAEIDKRLRVPGAALSSPDIVRDYVRLSIAQSVREVFGAMWLDAQHRVITVDALSSGTIDAASVYPREVARAAIRHNAAAVIFFHNHPSGVPEPSAADRMLTDRLKAALAHFDCRVVDHIVVGGQMGSPTVSFAERGWL